MSLDVLFRAELYSNVFVPYCHENNLFPNATSNAKEVFEAYYFPSFLCLTEAYERHLRNDNSDTSSNNNIGRRPPFFIGMSAPQVSQSIVCLDEWENVN